MSFWNPLNHFNGSKFYRLKSRYENEYFEKAKSVISTYKLNVRDLYERSYTRNLNADELYSYEEARIQGRLSTFKANFEKKELLGTTGSVLWIESGEKEAMSAPRRALGESVNSFHTNEDKTSRPPQGFRSEVGFTPTSEVKIMVTRKGLRNFTNALALYRATIESEYVWHLLSNKEVNKWITQASIQIALLILAFALKAIPIVGEVKFIAQFIKYTTWYNSLIAFIATMITDLINLYQNTRLQEIQSLEISAKSANAFLRASNDLREHKKLIGEPTHIFNGYRIYANGDIFKSESAGSETFLPTQAFNPTKHFLPQAKMSTPSTGLEKEALSATASAPRRALGAKGEFTSPLQEIKINECPPQGFRSECEFISHERDKNNRRIDELIQNRGHYEMAGNGGFYQKNAPNIPLAQIKALEQDAEFKHNFFTLHNQRLQRGYAELAPFLVDENERAVSNPASAQKWLQEAYNADIGFYADNYYDYLESKDFLNKLKHYNYALKADFFYYKRDKAFEYRGTIHTHTQDIPYTEQKPEIGEAEQAQGHLSKQEANFNQFIGSLALQVAKEEEQEDCFNPQSAIFSLTRARFLEEVAQREEDIIYLVYEKCKQWHIGEYKGFVYDILDESITEQYYDLCLFLNYAQAQGAMQKNGTYAKLHHYIKGGVEIKGIYYSISGGDGGDISIPYTQVSYEVYGELYTKIVYICNGRSEQGFNVPPYSLQKAKERLNVKEENIITKRDKEYILYANKEAIIKDFKEFITFLTL